MPNINIFRFFKYFTAKKHTATGGKVPPARNADLPVSLQPSHIRKRELIRVALKDTLRFHGLPNEWVRCEVLSVPHNHGTEDTLIQLVVKNWSDQLLRYSIALEKKLLQRLEWYEPEVDHSRFIVLWRYDKNCMCPYIEMPMEDFWVLKAEKPAVAKPLDLLDRRRSPRPPNAPVYIRDSQQNVVRNVLYAPTSIAPLA